MPYNACMYTHENMSYTWHESTVRGSHTKERGANVKYLWCPTKHGLVHVDAVTAVAVLDVDAVTFAVLDYSSVQRRECCKYHSCSAFNKETIENGTIFHLIVALDSYA